MNLTLKSGDYSCGNDCSYDGCRNGVSPFAVPPLSQTAAREDNLEYEAFEAATHRTPAESKKQIQGTKAPPPKSLQNAIKHLNNFIVWLEMLVGAECSHLLAVIRLRDCLDENEERLEPVLTDRLLLSILWKVHEDARQFFHRCEMWNRGEPLPKSNLKGMVRLLEDEMTVIESITCPYDEFFGKADKGKEKGKGKDRDKAKDEDQKKREPQATVNPNIPTLCAATVKKIQALHPGMSIPQFVAETGIPLKDLAIASRGGCTTFGVFGACRSNCPFKHDTRRNVPEGKQKDVNAALQKGLKVLEDKKKAASA
jgi:ferredoxin